MMPFGYFAISGFLVWRRRDDAMALLVAVRLVFLGPYLIGGVTNDVYAWGGPWVWVNAALVSVGCLFLILYLFLFPTGRFVPRWSWLIIVITALSMFVLDILDRSQIANIALFVGVALGIAAQVYRFRVHSTATQRQQTKWVFAGLIGPVFSVFWWLFMIAPGIAPVPEEPVLFFVHRLTFTSLALTFPLSIAVSVLRYRLWDIDIIIRRTLIYSLLTAVLVLVYLGSVVLLQGLVRVLTGESQSSLVTVLSTLAIAALFSPLRRRIQTVIDRRFYRRKVDAARALAAFGLAARDEVDLTRLADRLLVVVDDTIQPSQSSLWLRPNRGEDPK
jgi:hypothetical protein